MIDNRSAPRWLAYAAAPIEFDRTRVYDQDHPKASIGKPNGFWFTDDSENSWPDWCVAENFSLENLQCEHAVDVDLSNCIRLGSALDIDDFTARFQRPLFPGIDIKAIDWPQVAQRWAGIVITPYIWERRFDPLWYYGWDCASGCIWNLSAIRSVTPIGRFDLAARREAQRLAELAWTAEFKGMLIGDEQRTANAAEVARLRAARLGP